ncbi:GNAT family N-acetyltransferase [Ruegeria conchae]|uniref:L-amino acid N-acyltransferase YncA n=1 Tax=Ruegeria conchae TaxID=981384 RepID=A0A497YZS6_9RHOB|nr:GNAT family N-acetyltransferase [Ruegeria conchae]RLK00608.1 L-amino acid N-acyltransferase YncA [Ruegeria conchae]
MSRLDQPIIREAVEADADGIAKVLTELVAAGKRSKDSNAAFALGHYISDPERIRCSVAVTPNGEILGFQSLKLATENNPYEVAVGWGIIGTHIRPSAARRGVGRALFESTLEAARYKGLPAIDATIGAANPEGLGYYEAMGFREYRRMEGAICKIFHVPKV